MKKWIPVIIVVLFVFNCAFAEAADYSAMSFEELRAAKKELDAEYFSRPESAGVLLESGKYIVGETIKPGQYYAGMVKPDYNSSNAFLCIYKDNETFLREEPYNTKLAQYSGYFLLNDAPKSIILEEKNVVCISYGSLLLKTTDFEPSDYYVYEAPAGTLLPKGKYIVGTEIPSGTYNTYPGSASGGEFSINVLTPNGDGSFGEMNKPGYYSAIYLSVKKETDSEKIKLEDGDILIVAKSIILAKPQMIQIE